MPRYPFFSFLKILYNLLQGCFVALEVWLRDQKMIVLLVAVINLCVQLLILFAVVSSCVRSKNTNYDTDMNKPMTYMSHMTQRKY